MIQIIAKGLAELNDEVVYVGGSVTELYANKALAEDVRATEDVDIVVKIQSRVDFNKLETMLRKKGFRNDISAEAPICRWLYNGIKLDLMPDDPKILGFTNKWYGPGIENRISHQLDTGNSIYILPVQYYLATKLEAVLSRGFPEIRWSHDFEDVIFILDNNTSIENNIKKSSKALAKYLASSFLKLKELPIFEEAIECSLPYGSDDRAPEIIEHIESIITLGSAKLN